MNEVTYTLATDGGGVWPGLIVPAVILLIALATGAAILMVTRVQEEEPATEAEIPLNDSDEE